jgi:hypothetical protein
VTKCLYIKSKHKASKSQNVVLKSIPYFKIDAFKVLSSDTQIEYLIQKTLGLKATIIAPFDLMYFDNPSVDLISIYKEQFDNDSMLLIANIHSSKKKSSIWEALKENEEVTVTIDMFHCGALFFRKEQAKEHFKIRI